MKSTLRNCAHPGGLRVDGVRRYRCPACGVVLDLGAVERWVREAEVARDEAYLELEGEVGRVEYEDCQREVYRRRKVRYGLEESARAMPLRPEMVLVLYDAEEDSYRCRIFYKEPRPSWAPDSVGVGASEGEILALGQHENPTVRLVVDKVGEFHDLRMRLVDEGSPAPQRRVFYANEL
jgi:Zn-finger nucleic acid-binding protein